MIAVHDFVWPFSPPGTNFVLSEHKTIGSNGVIMRGKLCGCYGVFTPLNFKPPPKAALTLGKHWRFELVDA